MRVARRESERKGKALSDNTVNTAKRNVDKKP
jgi:hypothetical protein